MDKGTADWPRERRTPPAEMLAEAAAHPNGSVAEIDGSKVPDPNGYVPVEAIIGYYVIGPDGRPTGEYLRNPNAGPVRDDFTKLDEPDHWLGWLPDPAAMVRAELEQIIDAQVTGATVAWIKIIEPPVYLTGGRRMPDNPNQIIVTRAALALPLALAAVMPQARQEILTGVLSWVAAGLDTEDRRDRVWLDLRMSRERAEELLKSRIYELD